jgi:hypothetical protein
MLYWTLHPKIYILLKNTRYCPEYTRLGHKTNLKFKTEIIQIIFSKQNEMKLESNNQKKNGKFAEI